MNIFFKKDFLLAIKNHFYEGYDFPHKNQFICTSKQDDFLKSKELIEFRFLCGLQCIDKTHHAAEFFCKSFDHHASPVFVMVPYFHKNSDEKNEYFLSYQCSFEIKIQYVYKTKKIKYQFFEYEVGDKLGLLKHQIKQIFHQKNKEFLNKNKMLQDLNTSTMLKEKSCFEKTQTSNIVEKYKTILPKQHIVNAISTIMEHMKKGESYLANLTCRHNLKNSESLFDFKSYLIKWFEQKPAFGFYFFKDDVGLMSFSPERFLIKKNKKIATQPIKGTQKLCKPTLWKSTKEMAEHTMVVDLLRHDLNSVCVPGSVVVQNPFYIKRTSKLLQMESTILGVLSEQFSFSQLLLNVLPGGSITGTPKKRTCELIEQYELEQRGYYTGIAGIIEKNKTLKNRSHFKINHDNSVSIDNRLNRDFDFAILIRSVFKGRQGIYTGVGAGITTLSSPKDEFEEFCLKLRSFL